MTVIDDLYEENGRLRARVVELEKAAHDIWPLVNEVRDIVADHYPDGSKHDDPEYLRRRSVTAALVRQALELRNALGDNVHEETEPTASVGDEIERELSKKTGVSFSKGQGNESELAQAVLQRASEACTCQWVDVGNENTTRRERVSVGCALHNPYRVDGDDRNEDHMAAEIERMERAQRTNEARRIEVEPTRLGYKIHLRDVWGESAHVNADEARALTNALIAAQGSETAIPLKLIKIREAYCVGPDPDECTTLGWHVMLEGPRRATKEEAEADARVLAAKEDT